MLIFAQEPCGPIDKADITKLYAFWAVAVLADGTLWVANEPTVGDEILKRPPQT